MKCPDPVCIWVLIRDMINACLKDKTGTLIFFQTGNGYGTHLIYHNDWNNLMMLHIMSTVL